MAERRSRRSSRAFAAALTAAAAGAHSAGAFEPGKEHPLVGVYSAQVDMAIRYGIDVLLPSITWFEENAFMKDLVERAHQHRIQVYPSLAVAYDGYMDKHTAFAREHPEYWEKRNDGRLINEGRHVGLSFGVPEVRRRKVEKFTEMVTAWGLDGVMLDYCRFFGNTAGYHESIVSAFRARTGRDPAKLPVEDDEWTRFRAGYVTAFVEELRAALDQARPGTKIIACVNPDPAECLRNSMQDWATWLDRKLIDGVVTMIYERDTNLTLEKVKVANAAIRGRVPHMPMIAPYGGNLTTPELMREASVKCLSTGTGAVAFYRDDSIRELKLWDVIGEIARWNLDEIGKRPLNYVLNSSFENGLENWATGAGGGVETVENRGHSGDRCLQLRFPGRQSVRQIVDRGLPGGARSLRVSAWLDTTQMPAGGRISLEVSTNSRTGQETLHRIPLEVKGNTGWRQIEYTLPIGEARELKFVIVSLETAAEGGSLLVDDVQVSFSDRAAAGDPYRVQPDSSPAAVEPGTNVARGQIVRGSSFWENGFEYANAVDGDLSSEDYGKGAAWHSQRPARNQWITIYLPRVHSISRVRMLNASAQSAYRTREYKIEVSVDDHTYREVARGVLPDDGETWTEAAFPPSPARYIRFTGVTGFNLEYAVGLKEIEVY